VHETTARDGTTKLLLRLQRDMLRVETVVIPWLDRNACTVCVSSQVGCARGCTFCRTGRMGRWRDLSSDEILVQVWAAVRTARQRGLPAIENVVFMGMGDAADNADQVVRAARVLTDPHQFAVAPRRVTISTVAPTPDSFQRLGQAPAVLAWSVHSSIDAIRKQLVPTTRHTMAELRDALKEVLLSRSRRLRAVMLEVTLLEDINDLPEHADHLADFCLPLQSIPGCKMVVNLIPWNDIGVESGPAAQYRTPPRDRVLAYQRVLRRRSVLCYVRATRGDDEGAACGQLATRGKRRRQRRPPPPPQRHGSNDKAAVVGVP
jgi:23S rRNA (adenine2503-C2)-methyltransferase